MLIGGIFINVVRVKYGGLDICANMSRNLWFVECG